MRKLVLLGAVLVLTAGSAYAAPNLDSNSQKGSLLIFTHIDVRDNLTTIVRIVNDGDFPVYVRCIYSDAGGNTLGPTTGITHKNQSDFGFELSARKAIYIDARTGSTNYLPGATLGRFVFESPWGVGELVCYATEGPSTAREVVWNHLAGTAAVLDPRSGMAYEYTAHAFFRRGPNARTNELDNVLTLDGREYDRCPRYLVGQFQGVGTSTLNYYSTVNNGLTIASCTQDLAEGTPSFTRLSFEVWDNNELKSTGATRCVDSWWETLLEQDPYMVNAGNFGVANGGYYRVQSYSDSACGTPTAAVGIIGTAYSVIGMPGGRAMIGTNVTQAGNRAGALTVSPGIPTGEGTIR